jgi:Alg9-like mannosyltransferase family
MIQPRLKKAFEGLSIYHIMVIGFLLRLLAAVFSKGYAFHDDHFDVVELAQKWRDGINFYWMEGPVYNVSLIYPGIHYLLFEACEKLGITNPQNIMFVTRLLHAILSVLSIYYAYLLSLRLSPNKNTALLIAWLMAALWLFPFMSVHSLREFVCIPFLLAGSYHIANPQPANRSLFLAGLFFAIAYCFRIQSIFISGGMGLFLLFQKGQLANAFKFGIACALSYFLTQGLFDYLHYGNPFASTLAYFQFNANPVNIGVQPQGPWYQYIGTVAGILFLFPFILLVTGYFITVKMSKPLAMFFISSILFFAFHSYYSNKQERFILPFVPYFLILGVIGFRHYYEKNITKAWLRKATKFALVWFMIFNTAGLLVVTFTYSKHSRVEAMGYLRKKNDVENLLLEYNRGASMLPLYYLGKHLNYFMLSPEKSIDSLKHEIDTSSNEKPNYVIMVDNSNLEQRLQRLRQLYPNIKPEAVIHPGLVDRIVYSLNPKHNPNETLYIYKLN